MIIFFSFSPQTLVCPRLLRSLSQPEQLARLKAQIECEQPTSDLYKFFGKIEIFPDKVDVSTWGTCLPSNHTSGQSVRTSQHAYDFDGIELENTSTINADITLEQFCIDNEVTLRRASAWDNSNIPTNHNRDATSHTTSKNRSTDSQCLNSIPLGVTSFINGCAALNHASTGEGATVQRTTREGCDGIQNIECSVDAVGADPILNKSQALRSSPVIEGLNYIQAEGDRNLSSQACGNSVLLETTAKKSITSKGVHVLETKFSAGQLDSVFQETKSSPLGTENLLLRGARLKNTEYVIGKFHSILATYTLFSS